jgi:hypothetical protein
MKTKTTFVAAVVVAAGAATALAGPFTLGNLVVSQVGVDGSTTALSSAGTAVFLKEFSVSGSPVQSIALPTAASGSNRRLVNSGSATSEAFLTRSVDGRYLTLGGYDAAVGTASVVSTTAAANPRVIGRVDLNGNVDTTTALTDAYSGNNIRSVTSIDGSQFFTGGTASTGGGVRNASFGGTTSTQLSTSVTNVRVVNIANGQLYTSSASGAFQGVATVGSGIPTTSGQTIAMLPGMPTASGPSAYDYFFANSNTLYVADDRATASGGGLQKWTFNAGVWSLAYTLNSGLTAGLRGLTGVVNGGVATFYATTADATANKLVTVTDGGSASAFSTLATASANTAFRGVDFAPIPAPGTLGLIGLAGLAAGRRRR